MILYKNLGFLLFSVFLNNCFTVYPVREEIFETKILSSKDQEKIIDFTEIKHEFENKTLLLTIEETTQKVNLRSERILERKKIFYSYTKSDSYKQISTDDKPWNRDILGMFADIAALFEWITIPFRTISSTREQEMDRESITTSEKSTPPERETLTLILRAENFEILNRKTGSETVRIPLAEIKKIVPKTYQIEVLVYRKRERVSYKIIQLYEAMQDLKN